MAKEIYKILENNEIKTNINLTVLKKESNIGGCNGKLSSTVSRY